jgi:DNA-binding CsgD family transcriptional regulator
MLLGRHSERGVLDRLIGGARAGRSGVTIVRGEPGIGKTALLEHAVESASDLRVARAAGAESEIDLPFAALHQLCAPMLDRLDRLPRPQRDALAITFGLSEGDVPDRFFVGLAVLGLLAEATEERPLVCVVDDAQWLDKASAQALAFAARRLLAESVVMIFACREPVEALRGLPELVIERLADSDARQLLRSVLLGPLDERVCEQVVAETRGNPLALIELTRGLSVGELAGGFGLPVASSLESRIEERFLRRLEDLPDGCQRLLLLAAADPTGDPALVWQAAKHLGVAGSVLEPAESDGLLTVGPRIRFRHPLVRSAVYRAASAGERRNAHLALAEATDSRWDPDRRAWHLAEAAAGADEEVAAELERSAQRAQARGGIAAAAAFLERAVALTPDCSLRAERALTAAQTKYDAGAFDDALALLGTAEADAVDERHQARVSRLHAQLVFASRRGSDAPPLLLEAARRFESLDPGLARETYLEALSAVLYVGRLASRVDVVEVSKAALGGPSAPMPPGPLDLLLQGMAISHTEGYVAGAPILKEALSAISRAPERLQERWVALAGHVASDSWDDEAWELLSRGQLERAREAGALTALPFIIPNRAVLLALSGDLGEAASLIDELRAVSEATGIDVPAYTALRVAALRGDEDEHSELTETAVRDAVDRGEGLALIVSESTSAMLYNSLGRFDAALDAIRQVIDRPHETGSTRALPELVEAAARCGELDLARRTLDRLIETTRASGTDWALGTEARCHGQLVDGDAAESLYREAIDRLGRTRVRVELGRAHLLYGEWLRRERRRADAREQLRTAHGMFTAMGVEAFARRAERELSASGENVRKREVESHTELTAQEARIAQLARDGVSNGEIGARLFMSRRTVEYHLSKVFAKLGINSRHELDLVLPREQTPLAHSDALTG